MKIAYVRVCLGSDGSAIYWAAYEGHEDLALSPLPPEVALVAITRHKVPLEVATCDPKDVTAHGYETLFTRSDGSTTQLFELTRV